MAEHPFLDARLWDGRQAESHPIRAEPGGAGLLLHVADGGSFPLAWRDVTEGQTLNGRHRLLFRAAVPGQTDGVLEFDATAFRAAVQALPAVRRAHGRRLGLRRAPAFAWTFAALIGLPLAWFLYSHGMAMAHVLVPLEQEARLGRMVRDRMVAIEGEYDAPELKAAIERILAELGAGESRHRYQVTILDSKEANAFAAPGGQVVVLRGLLSKTEDPLELAGVLAHEMAHVEERHALRQVLRSLGVIVFMSGAVGGGFEGLEAIEGATELAGLFALFRYSRDMEREADRLAAERLHAVGLSARGLQRFFENLNKEFGPFGEALERNLAILSTHPQTKQRVAVLAGKVAEESGPMETPAWLADMRPLLRAHRPTQGFLPLIEFVESE